MDKKMIGEALGCLDEKYIIEALELSGRAYAHGKETENMNGRKITKPARILLIAAVLALALGITAGAYVAFTQYDSPDEMIGNFAGGENYKGGSAEGYEKYETIEIDGEERIQLSELRLGWERLSTDEALLEELVYPYVAAVEGGFTWEDYTVTMEACIYDKDLRGGILYYTVENPNGISWERNDAGDIMLEPGACVGTSFPAASFVDEERSTDTKLYICEHFIVVNDWLENEYIPNGLWIGNGMPYEMLDLVPYLAQWEMIKVPSVELDGGNIVVSPFGMAFDKNGIGVDPGTNHQYIALRFDDGSEFVVYDRPNLFANEVTSLCQGPSRKALETHLFNSIIDINALVEVQIDDAVFTID